MLGLELGAPTRALRGGVRAALEIDFVAGVYVVDGESAASFADLAGASFARTGGGTALTLSGAVQAFGSDVARITDRGLLLEPAGENLLAWSQAFDDAVWAEQDVTVAADVALAPDGSTTAEGVVPTSGVGYRVGQGVTLAAGLTTLSVHVAQAGYGFVRVAALLALLTGPSSGWFVDFDLSTGAVVTGPSAFGSATAAGLSARSVGAPNGFWRLELTFDAVAGLTYAAIGVLNAPNGDSFTADGTSGLRVWQADLVAGSGAASPIVTTAGAGTRGADAAALMTPPDVATYEATYGAADTMVTGPVTPGASFDLVAGRPWVGLGNELKRLVMR